MKNFQGRFPGGGGSPGYMPRINTDWNILKVHLMVNGEVIFILGVQRSSRSLGTECKNRSWCPTVCIGDQCKKLGLITLVISSHAGN